MAKAQYEIETLQHCIFWAKYDHGTKSCLPLVLHSLDVAMVFRALTELPGIRRALDVSSERPLNPTILDRLAFLVMLHDIGKANLGFQRKPWTGEKVGHIRELAPLFTTHELHQQFIQHMPEEMSHWFSSGEVAYSYFMAVFSHHGTPLRFEDETTGVSLRAPRYWNPEGSWDPFQGIAEVVSAGQEMFPCAFRSLREDDQLPESAPFQHRFAGLTMLADWIGSNPDWFPIRRMSVEERHKQNQKIIPEILRVIGLDVRHLTPLVKGLQSFEKAFALKPRPLQKALEDLPPDDASRLLIVESDTGSGKTEAALHWFLRLFSEGKVDSLYFALPTRVAAHEIYRRVHDTVCRWFPSPERRPLVILAVPGYPSMAPEERALPSSSKAQLSPDDEAIVWRERVWAEEHPKRFLAAPIAVGTVDQAILSTIQTAHAHLRSSLLDRSLLVVDEVHASDRYMSVLLKHLVEHHLSVGGYVLLMSATLGSRTRHLLVPKLPRKTLEEAIQSPYPAYTLGSGRMVGAHLADMRSKTVQFELHPWAENPRPAVEVVKEAVEEGARVLVIFNTVARSVHFFRMLEENHVPFLFTCRGIATPHHGRYAPETRLLLDREVTRSMGKESPCGPCILVGTQTLEQSLDIDADLMITDLAPADVLLQRIGRLHRHDRNRPPRYEKPRCLVLIPKDPLESALDDKGDVLSKYKKMGLGSVYEDLRVLELTIRTLKSQPRVQIPKDNRFLVESTTHEEALASLDSPRWTQHGRRVDGAELAKAIAAGMVTIPYDQYFGAFSFQDQAERVMTRLGVRALRLRMQQPFQGPFGETVREMIIPGHMAPRERVEEMAFLEQREDFALLQAGERRYRYSRLGLAAEGEEDGDEDSQSFG
ncbi:MAG: CRISPR-associated helicase Cas3' [Clostridiales bacterium]|nr:CRISPR-associated helicase Cas3' [Clostridiales bacterium]